MSKFNLIREKTLKEKMFFMKEINIEDYDYIIDFGCGTGKMLREIADSVSENYNGKLIGFDSDPEAVDYCNYKKKNRINSNLMEFFYEPKKLESVLKEKGKKLAIFSSVLHELSDDQQRNAINNIMLKVDTVVIRDMKRPLNNEPIDVTTRDRVISKVAPWQVELFESRWGRITDKYNLYRFFLMSEYVDNYYEEVEEDYFSVPWSEISDILGTNGFSNIYAKSFTLDYKKQQVKKIFNHVMHDITHRTVIFCK